MTYTIAMAGKGGTGKTTITGMLIEYLSEKSKGPILAVDADANENLNEVLAGFAAQSDCLRRQPVSVAVIFCGKSVFCGFG